jgi:hypothetical protein
MGRSSYGNHQLIHSYYRETAHFPSTSRERNPEILRMLIVLRGQRDGTTGAVRLEKAGGAGKNEGN